MNFMTAVRQRWLIAAAIVATSLSLTTAPTPATGKALGQPSPPNDVAAAAAVLGSAAGHSARVAASRGTPAVSLAEATERLFADEDRTNLQAALDAAAPEVFAGIEYDGVTDTVTARFRGDTPPAAQTLLDRFPHPVRALNVQYSRQDLAAAAAKLAALNLEGVWVKPDPDDQQLAVTVLAGREQLARDAADRLHLTVPIDINVWDPNGPGNEYGRALLDDTVGDDFFPVVSMDGCPGDSGGIWYSFIGSTRRRAVGYHQGQGPGEPEGSCHVARYHSNFTFASDAKTYFTQDPAATFTIVTR